MTSQHAKGAVLDDPRIEFGSLAAGGVQRCDQQTSWMWAMVDAELRDAVRHAPRGRELTAEITPGVREGRISAVEGAEQIIAAFAADLAERA